jgi:SPP1 gp7 family putative phage head morphogenesis protein
MAASPQSARIGKTYMPLATQIQVNNIVLVSQDIGKWRQAIDAARNAINPRRKLLYELYDSIEVDAHLTSVMGKRVMNITNKKLLFVPNEGGMADDGLRDTLLETPWFYELNKIGMSRIGYGHALIELVPEAGVIAKVEQFNRANVVPERHIVAQSYANITTGVDYINDPMWSKFIVESGTKKDLGLLMKAAPYVIYKRGGFGDWSQFAELFGMPLRVGKYDPYDASQRKLLAEGLEKMGGAGYVILPRGSDIEFMTGTGTGAGSADIYKELINICNAELSKLFLGQTLTTEQGDKGARSLGDVHQRVEETIEIADMIEHEYWLNFVVKPKLELHGFPVANGRFRFERLRSLPMDKVLEIAIKVAEKVPIDDEYWYTTFGIPKPEGGIGTADPEPEPEPGKPSPGKKKNLSAEVQPCCGHTDYRKAIYTLSDDPLAGLSDDERLLIEAMYDGDGRKYDFNTFAANLERLNSPVFDVFGGSAYDTPDNQMLTMMELNVNRFGFDKSVAQIQQLNELLTASTSRSDFVRNASKVLELYNVHYLNTEYDTAIAVAQNAAAWLRFKATAASFPYLKYQTAGDQRVRMKHAALDGKIFRVDDPSWYDLYPPNDWNCRCEMIQVDRADTKSIIDGPQGIALLGDDYYGQMKKRGFAANRGELKQVFDLNTGYLAGKQKPSLSSLTWKDAGLKPANKLKAGPAIEIPARKSAEVVNGHGVQKLYADYAGRSLLLKQGELKKILGGSDDKAGLYGIVEQSMKSPAEVWYNSGTSSHKYSYISLHGDQAIIVHAEVSTGVNAQVREQWVVKGFEKVAVADLDARRKGICIKSQGR